MFYLGISLAIFFILGTFVSVLKSSKWYFRIFDFPKLHITIVGVLGITLMIFSGNLSVLTLIIGFLSAVAFVYQVRTIFPYTPLSKKEVLSANDSDNYISILICNVFMDNKNDKRCKDVAKTANPDIMFFIETDDWWWTCLSDFQKDYPYVIKKLQANTYGLILFSKYRLYDSQVNYLIKDEIPSINTRLELPSGDTIDLWFLHPEPPVPYQADSTTNRDAELLIVGKKVKDSHRPVIVGGDLNDVAWSHTTRLFKRISHLLDPRVGRGLYSTFPANYPFLRWPLDHIFHSYHFRLLELRTLPNTGSDHLPIFIKLALDNENSKKHQNTTSEKLSDLQEMKDKISEAKGDQ